MLSFHTNLFLMACCFMSWCTSSKYRQLQVPCFAALYVRGFLNGGCYDGIPLERNTYELGGRFEAQPRRTFSVENEVSMWIKQDRF